MKLRVLVANVHIYFGYKDNNVINLSFTHL